jgi:hypothetical protein
MRLMIGAVCVSMALLGGCGKTEEQTKADLRTQYLAQCNTAMGASLKEKGLDPERYCPCTVDSMMKGRTTAEIIKMDKDGVGAEEASAKAASECLAQLQPASMPPPAAGSSEPAAAPAAEEAEAEDE